IMLLVDGTESTVVVAERIFQPLIEPLDSLAKRAESLHLLASRYIQNSPVMTNNCCTKQTLRGSIRSLKVRRTTSFTATD
ncbi:MAG: hypothetical protein ACKVKT_02230, partial [Rhodospirillales bacterium]